MRIQTKRTLLRAATAAALVCAAAVIFLPAAASAAAFTASSTVRVHARPSLNSPVIDTLRPGQTVNVGGCRQGWCYITDDRGFVSSTYLRNNGATVSPDFNLSFNFPQGSFSIGTNGVQIGVGNPPGPGPGHGPGGPGSGPGDRQACFYSSPGYNGQSICLSRGDQMASLPRGWNDRIASISNRRGLSVTVCRNTGFRQCRTYTTSAASLGSFDHDISSIRVR